MKLVINILIFFYCINLTFISTFSSTSSSQSAIKSTNKSTNKSQSKSKTNTSTESENKLTEKINISQRFLKAKKANSNKAILQKNLNNKKITLKNTFQSETEFADKKILIKGWIKYFKISLDSQANKKSFKEKKNKNFVINFQYNEQFKLFDNMDMGQRTPDGNFRYIRSKYNFWAILLNDSLNILSSREVSINK